MFVPRNWLKVSDEDLVAELIAAASANNEYDNRDNVRDAQVEVLRRLHRRTKPRPVEGQIRKVFQSQTGVRIDPSTNRAEVELWTYWTQKRITNKKGA